MKKGILSQTSYQRSVYKKLNEQNKSMPYHVWEQCTRLEGNLLTAEAVLTGTEKELCVYAAARAVNEVAAKGGIPFGIRVSVLVPQTEGQHKLEEMMECLKEAAALQNIEILHVQASVQPQTEEFSVWVSAFGREEKRKNQDSQGYDGEDLILINPIALEGSIRVLEKRKTELLERFVPTFLNPLEEQKECLFLAKTIEKIRKIGIDFLKPVTDGGILGALWELAETTGTGFEADLKKFYIRQETVEICEFFRLNPYQLASGGCMLVIVKDGNYFTECCERNGIHAVVIGKMKKGNDKIIFNGEERRCTDRPAEDEWFQMYKGGEKC
nr:AIR synthase-related protein [uncultured Sellimonas sp.]